MSQQQQYTPGSAYCQESIPIRGQFWQVIQEDNKLVHIILDTSQPSLTRAVGSPDGVFQSEGTLVDSPVSAERAPAK